MTAEMTLGMHSIGDGRPVCVVFEAGPTHDGIQTAKKLVDVAVQAGADAIKFQMLDAKKLVPSPETRFTYETLIDKASGRCETITESLQEILLRRELSRQEWAELIAYCKSFEILFFNWSFICFLCF